MTRQNWENMKYGLLRLAMVLVLALLCLIIYQIVSQSIGIISWEFITAAPREGMTAGGIFPALVGTIYVTLLTTVLSVPLGVGAAIYLNEYASNSWLTRLIRLSVRNLAGVPSIVYGLFGLALFVQRLQLGTSILAAGLTLGLLTLPVTVTATEEALKTVPNSYREAGYALGSTRWQVIRWVVLPVAMPGILTGSILAMSRAAGETAPIMFTGVAFFLPALPDSPFSQFMALPYHLYILSTQHQAIEQVRPLAYGTAAVLLLVVSLLNLGAIVMRIRYRRRVKG